MESQKRDILLWTDFILTALAAAWICCLLARCQEYLSSACFWSSSSSTPEAEAVLGAP